MPWGDTSEETACPRQFFCLRYLSMSLFPHALGQGSQPFRRPHWKLNSITGILWVFGPAITGVHLIPCGPCPCIKSSQTISSGPALGGYLIILINVFHKNYLEEKWCHFTGVMYRASDILILEFGENRIGSGDGDSRARLNLEREEQIDNWSAENAPLIIRRNGPQGT